ncbi:histidine phosphatase family protein [Streptomyces sp. NPDC050564]|uniref:histidine phosphatase family protein n=1 Tax=Streptomyces sp. NPDC050564 TaxID=3365631 RepID=UPI0037AAD2E8
MRHAETDWNRSRRFYTRQDDPDPPRASGRLRCCCRICRDAQVLCSPALRARRTAQLAGLDVDISPDLREWSYRLPDGHTVDDRCRSGPCHHDVWDDALQAEVCTGERLRK